MIFLLLTTFFNIFAYTLHIYNLQKLVIREEKYLSFIIFYGFIN